jgi:hypothetical protein
MALRRTPLGRSWDLSGRQHVYEGSDALEVDDFEGYAGQRRRVFYDEVILVTTHRRRGWPAALVVLALAGSFGLVAGLLMLGESTAPFALVLTLAGVVPLLLLALVRLLVKLHVVTVYGKRSQARVQFWLRPERARQAFQRVCARVRQAHPGTP